MKHQKFNVSHIFVSNKVQNVRQHHFETNKGFIYDSALHCTFNVMPFLTTFFKSVQMPNTCREEV